MGGSLCCASRAFYLFSLCSDCSLSRQRLAPGRPKPTQPSSRQWIPQSRLSTPVLLLTQRRCSPMRPPPSSTIFPPFLWSGKTAVEDYSRDLKAVLTKYGITDWRFQRHQPRYLLATEDRAWLVVPASFPFLLGGKTQSVSADWVFVLEKIDGKWRVNSSVFWSGPLGADSDQAADLTVGRGLRSSNCCGLR